MNETKASLRDEYRKARKSFALSAGRKVRTQLEAHALRLMRDLRATSAEVCLYRPQKDEAQFEFEPRQNFFYPRIESDNLRFLKPDSARFLTNKFGIEEPDPSKAEALGPGRHLIFTPAVAVDTAGGRLGMGKGYYDRIFQSRPECIRIGLVYQVQVSKNPLPADEWDQKLDWIVTEQMILQTSRRSS